MTSSVFSKIESQLTERMVADAGVFFGASAPAGLIKSRVLANPYSTVLVVDLDVAGSRRVLYAKVPNVSESNRAVLHARLKSEFDVMKAFSMHPHDARYGVATPFAYYPDFPAVVTLGAEGRPLRESLRLGARRIFTPALRRMLLEHAVSCGQWLHEFQGATSRGTACFDVDELLSYCRIRLDLLLEEPVPGFSADLADGIIESVLKVSASLDCARNQLVGRHNDFASHNIITDDRSMRVIDFSMYDLGSFAYDPCNFWLELEMLKYDWTYSRPFLTRLQESFLQAYGAIRPDDAAFKLARVRYALNRLLTAVSASRGWRPDARYRRRAAEVSHEWLLAFAQRARGHHRS